jgi:hypothetical protein
MPERGSFRSSIPHPKPECRMVSQLPSRCVRFSGARADIVGVMSFLPLNELPALFPHVVDWISYLEKQAQESGRALTPIEFNLAQNIGVAHPGKVRILSFPRIPLPAHPRVKQLAQQVGLLNADTGGLTAGYGVIVRLDCAKDLRLLAHESVHVAQYERLGRERFLHEYIQQIAAHGYLNAPFEQEAEAKAIKACRDARVHPFLTFPDPLKRRPISAPVCRPRSCDAGAHYRARQ